MMFKVFFLLTNNNDARHDAAVVCAMFPLALGYKTISGHTKGLRAYIYIMRNLPGRASLLLDYFINFSSLVYCTYATCRCGARHLKYCVYKYSKRIYLLLNISSANFNFCTVNYFKSQSFKGISRYETNVIYALLTKRYHVCY